MSREGSRNPFSSIQDDPITREDVRGLYNKLCNYWEDTSISTDPNNMFIVTVGNLRAILETLLACKDFDTPQIMMEV